MKYILRTLSVVVLLTSASPVSLAQDGYSNKLKSYLEASGALNTFKTAINTIIGNVSQNYPSVPKEFWTEFSNEMSVTSIDDLVTLIAPVYKKHLTESDLDEIIGFYNSPIGKKLAAESPALTQESMMVGQEWGQQIGMKIGQKLKDKGYK